MRSDGEAVACGADDNGQCRVPPRKHPSDPRYVSAAAGSWHTVLLRDDGEAVAVAGAAGLGHRVYLEAHEQNASTTA